MCSELAPRGHSSVGVNLRELIFEPGTKTLLMIIQSRVISLQPEIVNSNGGELTAHSSPVIWSIFKANQGATWPNAKSECEGEGMHLLSIEIEEELEFIKELLRDAGIYSRSVWTRANDLSSEGTWVWDGVPHPIQDLPLWRSGEPNGDGNCWFLHETTPLWFEL
ncbi:hypothetical protein CAPTEDRAFT_197382 [Capitella teleta]|uniref:C-type lectin domain-containing protein n=1 Tax=Capitella teleta TaxID=283909 RepID=R7TP77_CAPTE|nr:hypothetical protein CAPTEDRAFT_197382 [Capitella teleta]|eukprot:ELT95703.1 hypothetical protein CAPTEDRAFT_197382 [Capitella teleta]